MHNTSNGHKPFRLQLFILRSKVSLCMIWQPWLYRISQYSKGNQVLSSSWNRISQYSNCNQVLSSSWNRISQYSNCNQVLSSSWNMISQYSNCNQVLSSSWNMISQYSNCNQVLSSWWNKISQYSNCNQVLSSSWNRIPSTERVTRSSTARGHPPGDSLQNKNKINETCWLKFDVNSAVYMLSFSD